MTTKKDLENKEINEKRIFSAREFLSLILSYLDFYRKKEMEKALSAAQKKKHRPLFPSIKKYFEPLLFRLQENIRNELIRSIEAVFEFCTRAHDTLAEKVKNFRATLKGNVGAHQAKLINRALQRTITPQNTYYVITQAVNSSQNHIVPRPHPIADRPLPKEYQKVLNKEVEKMPTDTVQDRVERIYTDLLYRLTYDCIQQDRREVEPFGFETLLNTLGKANLFRFDSYDCDYDRLLSHGARISALFENDGLNPYSFFSSNYTNNRFVANIQNTFRPLGIEGESALPFNNPSDF